MRTKEQRLQLYKSKLERRGPELVRLIKDGWKSIQTTSLQVGMWLLEFRDGEYWKKNHTTFNEARDELFGISERYGQFLIKGAETVKSLPPSLQAEITTESQARALSVAPPEQRAKIVEKLAKNGGVTAEKIEDIVSRITQKNEPETNVTKPVTYPNNCSGRDLGKTESEMGSKPKNTTSKKDTKVELDKVGIPVPDEALPYWSRYSEVWGLMEKISDVKCAIEKAKLDGDPMYAGVSNNFVVEMRSAYAHIKDGALPYAVCTQCMGTPSLQPDGCSFCKNTGLIPEWRWNTQSIKEVKEMRIKIAADLAAQSK